MIWPRPSTPAQRGVEACLLSGGAHIRCQCQFEVYIPTFLASLESEGQTIWQEDMVRKPVIFRPDWKSGDLKRLTGSLSRARSSFQLTLRPLVWAPMQSPFRDISWRKSKNSVAHQLTAMSSLSPCQKQYKAVSILSIGTWLSNKYHAVVKKPYRATRLCGKQNCPSDKISNYVSVPPETSGLLSGILKCKLQI